jgi:AbrB family looped-hinge helix DNA binding protein
MAKVTSKYQVTVPKAVADRYGIRTGDEIEWVAAGDIIRVIRKGGKRRSRTWNRGSDCSTRLRSGTRSGRPGQS